MSSCVFLYSDFDFDGVLLNMSVSQQPPRIRRWLLRLLWRKLAECEWPRRPPREWARRLFDWARRLLLLREREREREEREERERSGIFF